MSQLAKLEIFNPRQYAILNAKAYEAIRRNRAGVIATAPPAAPPEVPREHPWVMRVGFMLGFTVLFVSCLRSVRFVGLSVSVFRVQTGR